MGTPHRLLPGAFRLPHFPNPNCRHIGTTMNPSRIALAIGLLFGIGVSACSDDNPADPGSSTDAPNAGTSYTLRGVTTDELGRILQSRDIISVIVETNQSYFGRTGLVKMVTAGSPGYLQYGANGDIATVYYVSMNGVLVDSSWISYPFGSKGSSALPAVNQNLSGFVVTSQGEITYVGTESVTVPAGTFETQKVRIATRMAMGSPDGELMRNERIDTVFYSSAVRYFVKQSGIQHQIFGDDTTTFYNVGTLSSYSLK
jgi:hypothetical protein